MSVVFWFTGISRGKALASMVLPVDDAIPIAVLDNQHQIVKF